MLCDLSRLSFLYWGELPFALIRESRVVYEAERQVDGLSTKFPNRLAVKETTLALIRKCRSLDTTPYMIRGLL